MTPEELQAIRAHLEQHHRMVGPEVANLSCLCADVMSLFAEVERLGAQVKRWEALGQRLYEELDEMRTQFLSDGPFVGWRERQKDAVDEALAAYKKAQQGEKPSDE